MSCCHGGMGIPFSVHCQCHGYRTLSLDVFTYSVIVVYHPERGSAMNLMKTPAQWESCGHRTAHKANEGVKRAKLLVACY